MADSETFDDLKTKLSTLLQPLPKVLFLGVGENRMGDDGAGPWLSFELDQWCHLSQIKIINGGIIPEQRLEEILAFNPDIIFLLDAMQTDAAPGTVELLEEDRMRMYLPISTHSLPIPVFLDRVRKFLPEVLIYLIGICPFQLEFSDRYEMFHPDIYSLDDYDEHPNIPFYAFHLLSEMESILTALREILKEILTQFYESS